MKIKNICIDELFGLYKYNLDLIEKDKSLVTIIDAPNGKGKTSILQLTQAILGMDLKYIEEIPFKSFSVVFDDNKQISLVKKEAFYSLVDDLHSNISKSSRNMLEENKDEAGITYIINDNEYPISVDKLISSREGRLSAYIKRRYVFYSQEDDMPQKVNRNLLYSIFENEIEIQKINSEIKKIIGDSKVFFIKANRLYKEVPYNEEDGDNHTIREKTVKSVLLYKEDIVKNIEKARNHYGINAERIDRTFYKRAMQDVINLPNEEVSSVDLLNTQLSELDAKRQKLVSLGLLANNNEPLWTIPNNMEMHKDARIFSMKFIDDTMDKLYTFNRLEQKMSLFLNIINKNGFSDKIMRFDDKEGVVFESRNGKKIPINKLSSGEMNEFVLFYELIFKCEANSLILIDEPEISLHIAWQQSFIDQLIEISRMKSFQSIVATHSPNIVDSHWNLMVDLVEEE